jgi:hypothetical protein
MLATDFTVPTPSASLRPRKSNFLTRVFEAIMESRQRKADREIAEILSRRSGVMSDEFERRLGQRLDHRSYPFRVRQP